MKLLQLYNQYRSLHGGEETVVRMIDSLMKKHEHKARLLMRSSRGLDGSLLGRAKAFVGAFYNTSAYAEVAAAIETDRPDVVHVHNLYPLFSPSVLAACRAAGVPVVMTNHNYLLTCPTTHHLRRGKVCEKCIGGKEYHCALTNCRGNLAESIAYAARSVYARRQRYFYDYVSQYIVLTQFAKRQLSRVGFDANRIHVLPNMVDLPASAGDASQGDYVAYSGRMSREKGVDTLLAAMRWHPEVSLKLAGDGPLLDELRNAAPPNCEFLGRLDADQMQRFYRGARLVVIPSRNYEGCPLVVSEAMSHGLPLVVSEMGGLPDLMGGDACGRTFPANEPPALAEQIALLWNNPSLCKQLGEAGRLRAEREYSEAAYYERLLRVYAAAARRSPAELTTNSGTASSSAAAYAGVN